MQPKPIKRQTLLQRWTFRYVLTLFIGLLTIGLTCIFWIREDTIRERKQSLEQFAQEAARYVTDEKQGEIAVPPGFYEWIDSTQRRYQLPGQFSLSLFDRGGAPVFYKIAPGPPGSQALDIGAKPPSPDRFSAGITGDYYLLNVPVLYKQSPVGTMVIAYAYHDISSVNQNYMLIGSLLLCAGLLGWTIIYLLIWNLRKPVVRLSEALRKMEAGDYDVDVPDHVKEKEIHELLVSFRTLAARLGKLEELRTELLAGVTHELKTPVASIHGLIRAVRDQVVADREAEEFLDISLEQTRRLQHMVTDLLDFNAFASGSIKVRQERIDLGKLLGEIVYQWEQLYQDEGLEIVTDIPDRTCMTVGDAGRIQQIIVNLLNNSRQAFQNGGTIRVALSERSDHGYVIIVRDNGPGIPENEQANIFERYYRGGQKKLAVGGLGLGLTYSRMLATAMNGQLRLAGSSPGNTTFEFLLPGQRPE
ncbi:sensor histidine kinase [Paenibacillus thalictri]|uniref:histidine kinase n=1 Tax=Paenibacillus thalictri TaxID=2527873 RepID=A0A4Q9DYR8_9BACL|nr:HAMP domain-containing sensor histidine kinase [Paenibacillus thalictri]TBL81038.1 HAMP domain-containing histidine kinase [Paenibacillus thalictri]